MRVPETWRNYSLFSQLLSTHTYPLPFPHFSLYHAQITPQAFNGLPVAQVAGVKSQDQYGHRMRIAYLPILREWVYWMAGSMNSVFVNPLRDMRRLPFTQFYSYFGEDTMESVGSNGVY